MSVSGTLSFFEKDKKLGCRNSIYTYIRRLYADKIITKLFLNDGLLSKSSLLVIDVDGKQ